MGEVLFEYENKNDILCSYMTLSHRGNGLTLFQEIRRRT